MGEIFLPELLGTMMLILLGNGVVANVVLADTKGNGGGNGGAWLLINMGWGLAVMSGVYVGFKSGAHINPAVTIGLVVKGDVAIGEAGVYIVAQVIGAFIGAVLVWVTYRDHYDRTADAAGIRATFSTEPAVRNTVNNVITEAVGTFVLVFVILTFGNAGRDSVAVLGPLPVALLVVGIGASLGGPTGYAINPARDLGPRIAHAILPISNKGDSDWSYSWVPIVGPIVGGAVAAGLHTAVASSITP